MRVVLVASLLLAHAAQAQTLPVRTAVTLGANITNPNDELLKVTDARRLPDGRIVVSVGNPLELRVYDRSGKLLNRIGRKGGGPGEFRTAVTIPYADNDSIVTFAQNYNRFAVFTTAGKVIHEYDRKPTVSPPALLHRAVLRTSGGAVNGCARAVMMSLPLVTPTNLHEVIADRSGHLWAHALGTSQWRVYSQAGPLLGIITLPAGATVLDLGADYLLAHVRDADDVEQVIEFRASIPAGALAPPCAAKSDSFPFPSTDTPRVTVLKQVFRDAMTAHEVFFSNVGRYSKTADSLKMKLPEGVVFKVIEASGGGYANVVLDSRSTLFCVTRMANGTFSWPEATTFCGN